MRIGFLLLICCSLLLARRADLVLPVDSLGNEHLERSIRFGTIADTFRVSMDGILWDFSQKRNSAQNIYEGVEVGKDTLASTAILYGVKLYGITDSTLLISGKRQVKREGKYYDRVSTSDSISVYKTSLKKVTLGKTKRQRLVFPIIAISVFGALGAIGSYNNRD